MMTRLFCKLSLLGVLVVGVSGCDEVATRILYPVKKVNRAYKVPDEPPAGYEQVYFDLQQADGTPYQVHGWHRFSGAFPVTILYLHGNGENIASLHKFGFLKVLEMAQMNIVVIDYPNYGLSKGAFGQETFVGGAVAAARFAKEQFPEARLFIWGWSMGAAVATQTFAQVQDQADGLILTSAWTSLYDVAITKLPSVVKRLSPAWLKANAFDSAGVAPSIEKPVLIQHGDKDDLIPVQFGRELASQFKMATWNEFPEKKHNDLFGEKVLWEQVVGFVKEVALFKTSPPPLEAAPVHTASK